MIDMSPTCGALLLPGKDVDTSKPSIVVFVRRHGPFSKVFYSSVITQASARRIVSMGVHRLSR